MRRSPDTPALTVQLTLEPSLFKELLRDLLFREAGQPYFKRLAIPRHHRWLGPWRTLSTYEAERHLLPVGGHNIDTLIQRFFRNTLVLRAEFHQGGMPVTAIRVLRQYCQPLNMALERVHSLECRQDGVATYQVEVRGGPTPPGLPVRVQQDVC
ncbi:MAG: hypothetical protein AB7N91_30825 [Candidatus Tectimicrobiota bacterium]